MQATTRESLRRSVLACALPLTFVATATLRAQVTLPAVDTARAPGIRYLPPSALGTSGALYDEIARMDSVLYAALAGANCSPTQFEKLFTDDAEFYDDAVGGDDVVGFETRAQLMARFRRWMTQGCLTTEQAAQRTLVPGSLRVYPLSKYGAVELGRHQFMRYGNGWTTASEFVILWRRENGAWRVSRMTMFDSHAVPRR